MKPTIKSVMAAASLHYGLPDVSQKSRKSDASRARHVAMYVARHMTGRSYKVMARIFCRDHTTVIAGVRKVEQLRQRDAQVAADITAISAMVTSGVAL